MLKKISITLFVIIVLILLNSGIVMADNTSTLYSNATQNNKIAGAGAMIAGWLRYGALVIAVVMLMVKGIKFITASPEGKAEVKKELIPWAIGVFILFTFNLVLQIFVDRGQGFNNAISKPPSP